jgi:hypothetical protein
MTTTRNTASTNEQVKGVIYVGEVTRGNAGWLRGQIAHHYGCSKRNVTFRRCADSDADQEIHMSGWLQSCWQTDRVKVVTFHDLRDVDYY